MGSTLLLKEIINIGPDENNLDKQTCDLCATKRGLIFRQSIIVRGVRQKYDMHLVHLKARKLLHYKTSTSVIEAVKKTADYIRKSGVKKFCYHIPLEIVNEKTPKTWTEKSI